MMYMMISTADIANAVGMLHHSIALLLFASRSINTGTMVWNFNISYSVISLAYRTSVFYNVVLGVSRTICILDPFYRIKKKVVIVSCIVYPLIWVGVIGYDVCAPLFDETAVSGTEQMIGLLVLPLTGIRPILYARVALERVKYYTLSIIFVAVPFLLPVVVVVVTCVIQIASLYKSSMGVNDNQRHVTVTILMMSVLFVISNSAFALYMVLCVFDGFHKFFDNGAGDSKILFLYAAVLGSLLPIINAAFNPVIIAVRSSGMRKDFREMKNRILGRCGQSEAQHTDVATAAITAC